ncbi:MAG: SDR family oxidoreductase [Mycobacteriales bacterium]
MITVIGATGKTGQHVVKGLVERGVAVRAFVRDAEKAKSVLPEGVELEVGDLADREAVRRAVTGADKVYLALGQREDQQQLEEAVAEESAAAGVRHIVKISVPGASLDSPANFSRWHAAAEARIAALGIASTILRPNWFSQNFLGSASTIASHDTFYAAAGSGHIAPIDVRDIAAVAVAALTEDGHEGADYYLTGPESLTHQQIASRLGNGIGRPVNYVDLSDEDFRASLVEADIPGWYADVFIILMQGIRAGWFGEVSPVVEKVLGRPATSFEDFARDHAAAFTA